MVAADIEDLVALQVKVAVEGLGDISVGAIRPQKKIVIASALRI